MSEATLSNWETHRNIPLIRYYPKIFAFLGYDPFPIQSDSLGAKILKYRRKYGLTYPKLARLIGTDEGHLVRIVKGDRKPSKRTVEKILKVVEPSK